MRFIVFCLAIISQSVTAQSSRFSVIQDWQPYVNVTEQKDSIAPWSFNHALSFGNLSPARFLSADPLADKFPDWSPYHYSANNPIVFVDPTGKEWYYYQADGQEAAQWNYHKDTESMTVWTGGYNDDGSKTMEFRKGIVELLAFNGSQLDWHQAEGGTQSWPAVSGVLDVNGQTQLDLQTQQGGPIPEGWYSVDPKNTLTINQTTDVIDFIKWLVKFPAWGEANTPILTPEGSRFYSYGRSAAYLHGGTASGSAGCIDLTRYNSQFHTAFTVHGQKLPLGVNYDPLRRR